MAESSMKFLFLLSVLACLAIFVSFAQQNVKCGSPAIKPDTSTSIVGGKDVIPYSWPWQVLLVLKSNGMLECGGSLISPQWVMTAGHCVGSTTLNQTQVRLGVFNQAKKNESGAQAFDLSEVHVHPEFNFWTLTYDIALLKLVSPVTYSDHISPVCLPSALQESLPAPNTTVFITGWGVTEEDEDAEASDTLQQVGIPLQSSEKCRNSYEEQFYEDVQFCAGLDQGGHDHCYGDSGGPVVFQDAANNGNWKQIGIVSGAKGCARPKYYGINSKVSAYVDFIKKYVTDL